MATIEAWYYNIPNTEITTDHTHACSFISYLCCLYTVVKFIDLVALRITDKYMEIRHDKNLNVNNNLLLLNKSYI